MNPRRSALAAAAVLALAGCGGSSHGAATAANPNAAEASPPGDIPDNQAFVRYSPRGGGYSLKVPEGWARRASNRAVTFTDKLNSIRIESRPGTGLPTLAQAGKAGKASFVQRRAGRAVRVTYEADSAPDPVTGKVVRDAVERYVFSHGNRQVVLTLSGPKGADNVDPWKLVTDSLAFR